MNSKAFENADKLNDLVSVTILAFGAVGDGVALYPPCKGDSAP